MLRTVFPATLALLLSQCAHDPGGNPSIAASRYSELSGEIPRPAGKYRITMTFSGKDEVVTAPSIVSRPGKEMKVEMLREFVYPTDFKPAEMSKVKMPASNFPNSAGVFPVTPTSPKDFTTRQLGYTGTFTVEPRGAFVIIRGMISHERFAGFSRAPGEAISPIVDGRNPQVVISDNRVDLPNFVRSETPVYIAGLPGVPHVIDLPAIPGKVTLTCEPVD
jgi:hypothetical protein